MKQTSVEELKSRLRQLHVTGSELSQLTHIASHNIRGPIREIYTTVEGLLRTEAGTISNHGRASFRRIQSSLNRMNLLLDDFFRDAVMSRQAAWRRAIVAAVQSGIPVPCLSAALAYFDGYRSARLPANLLQAQRDYFGAHTYERVDQPRGQFSHTDWTGHGGETTSRSYSA